MALTGFHGSSDFDLFQEDVFLARRRYPLIHFIVIELLAQNYGPEPYLIEQVKYIDRAVRQKLKKLEEL